MDVGDRVYRKGTSPKRWGIIRGFRTLGSDYQTADVDWYAPHRIGGRGFHRSNIRLTSLHKVAEDGAAPVQAVLPSRAAPGDVGHCQISITGWPDVPVSDEGGEA
jgi:hypothetical protein